MLYLSGDNHGNSCYFGFPLYYCQYDHVKALLDKVLFFYGEEKIQVAAAGPRRGTAGRLRGQMSSRRHDSPRAGSASPGRVVACAAARRRPTFS